MQNLGSRKPDLLLRVLSLCVSIVLPDRIIDFASSVSKGFFSYRQSVMPELRILIIWVMGSSGGVQDFLNQDPHLPFVSSLFSMTKSEKLCKAFNSATYVYYPILVGDCAGHKTWLALI